jgi:uncharacterized repeat protein (TIGR01451 family)
MSSKNEEEGIMSTPTLDQVKIRRLLLAILPVVLALIAVALIMPRSAVEARVTQTALIPLSPNGVQYPGAAPCNTTLQACIAALPTGETINILPGVYVESITLNKRVSLIGAGSDQTTLRASSGRVLTITGAAVDSSVVISGLMITGGRLTGTLCPAECGGGIYLAQSAQPLFYNVIISDNVAAYGAGIYAYGSPLTLTNVSLISNTSQRRGAGVYAQYAVQVNGGRFEHNFATIDTGGAIYAGATLNVSNATFRSNSSLQGGAIMALGATSIGDSLFFDNAVSSGGYGGAVMVQGATTIVNSWFENNGTAQVGGAVYIVGASTIDHSSFISNTANLAGGVYASGQANLSDVTFISNTAVNGNAGAVHLGPSSAEATIVNGVFENNRSTAATGSGGAIASDANLLIMSSHVISNYASTNGGGIDSSGPIVLMDMEVSQNQAGWYGGGVYAMGLVRADNSQFISNTAGRGYGGLYAHGTTTVTLSLFQNNVAPNSGGMAVTGRLTLDRSRFVGNIATDGNAAGLFSNFGADVSNTYFEDNRCVTAQCLGGGYYVGDVATATGLTFVNNFAAGSGGGLATRRAITLERSLFLGNHANDGGGFYQQGSIPAEGSRVVNNLFARNTVTNAGTAIAVNTLGGVTLLHNTIGDPALNAKSAIHIAYGTVGITNTIISSHAVGINRVLGSVYEDYNIFFANTLDLAGTIGSGGHSHQGDPRFADPAVDNYRLRASSIALDAAIDAGVTNDLDGNVRPQGAGFDIGAYESALLDLMLTKSAPSVADLGEPLTYTLVVTNAGPAMATDVIVTDVLPANVNLISVSNDCVAGSVVVCTFGALPVGVAGSAQIVVSSSVAGTLVNTAEATAQQLSAIGLPPVTVSISTTIAGREATTTTAQSHPNPSIVGQPAVFTATVTAAHGTPTGDVTFKYGGTSFGTATLNNGAVSISTTALPYGDWPVVAEYGGDGAFKPSVSAAITHSIILPPQGYRDFGSLRVWADNFGELGGRITALGHVFVGPKNQGDAGKWYSVSDNVVAMTAAGPVTMTGQLAFVAGGVPLINGTYKADRASGVVTLLNSSIAYTQLGTSEIRITPTLSINLLQREVDAQALVFVTLPETQTINSTFLFKIGPNNAITATASQMMSIQFAGGRLLGDFSAGPEGINIKNVTLDISGTQRFSIANLVIDNKFPQRLRLSVGTQFTIPQISTFDGGFQLNGITAALGLDFNPGEDLSFNIDLKIRSLQLPTLPFTSSVMISDNQPINLKLSKGVLSGAVPNFQVTVFGQSAKLSGVKFQHNLAAPPANFAAALNAAQSDPIEYHLFAKQAEFKIPKAWQQKLITDTNLTSYFLIQDMLLTSRPPFFRVNTVGGRFAISETYYLAGDAQAKAAVKFDRINGLITWTDIGQRLALELESRIMIQLGTDWSSAGTVRLYMNDQGITATLKSVDLVLAGINVKLERLDYTDDVFSAVTATLQLPTAWGSGKVVVSNFQISSTGVTIGGAGGEFTIPDKQLGIIGLRNMRAAISVTAQSQYLVQITATVAISSAQNAVSTSGGLSIHNGRIDGTITGFGFKLGGVEFTVKEPKWVDDRITAKEIGLVLPSNLGGFGTTIYGLEIGGPSGFKIAGGKFKVPDFTIGNVGVKNVLAEFVRLTDGSYSIAAGAKIGFEAFAVDGGFTLLYIPQPPEVRLRQVRLAFEGTVTGGTAIPIANTGAFITHVSGSFDLTSGTLEVRFGIRITGVADFLGIPLIAADGEVIVRARPFELQTNAYTRLLGIRVNQVNMRITSRSFTLSAQTELQIARAALTLAFGFDAQREFTAYGSAAIELGLRQGSIGCILFACLPPWDVTLARSTFDAGKFYFSGQKVWGARGMFSLFGANWYAFVQFAPGTLLRTGFNLNDYQPVPISLAAQNAGPDGGEAAARPYGVNVTGAATDLWIVEAITTTNRSNPQPIAIISPNGAAFTKTIVYESANKDERIYRVALSNANQAAGQWIINVQNGNAIGVWGADPAPQADAFTVTTPQGVLLPIEQQATPRFTFNGNESFDFAWTVSDSEPGFAVEVYVEDAQGVRHSIDSQKASTQTFSGHVTWTPALPSGTYTVTLSVDDYKHTPSVSRQEPILINDTTPPAAPINLIAAPRGDGSVLLMWDGSTAEADVAGYRVSVDGGTPQSEAGRLSQYEAFGLAPDSQHQFAVSAYDTSGNVGPAAIANAVMPSNGLVSQTPRRDETATLVNEVSFAFARPITLTAFTLTNDHNIEVTGTLTPITLDVTVDEIANMGAHFTPTIGPLGAGHYTATVSVYDAATNQSITENWSFTVLAPVYQVHLPIVKR